MNLKNLVRENILNLSPYSTARDEEWKSDELEIFLDANENPYDSDYNRYPDPHQTALKEAIAKLKKISSDKIFLGNGSDEAIDIIMRTFCEPGRDKIVTMKPSYAMYRTVAVINNIECREVALDDKFRLCSESVLREADKDVKMIILCSPNNPTGNLMSRREVEKIIEGFNGIVVIDEAFIDFADDEGFLSSLDTYPNLIILQTFSKSLGMASLRIGMAFASQGIIDYLNRVKLPYNMSGVSQSIAFEQIMLHLDSKKKELDEIKLQRDYLIKEMKKLPYIRYVYPSDSNFILIKTLFARDLYKDLIIERGMIVRDKSNVFGCEDTLRITVGTPEQNSLLIQLMKDYEKLTVC